MQALLAPAGRYYVTPPPNPRPRGGGLVGASASDILLMQPAVLVRSGGDIAGSPKGHFDSGRNPLLVYSTAKSQTVHSDGRQIFFPLLMFSSTSSSVRTVPRYL
jgi:hypothetical protein